MSADYAIAVHGGAGHVVPENYSDKERDDHLHALAHARDAGYAVLEEGGSALEAVVESVRHLEDCPLFNAGKGAVFNDQGVNELDASVMDGRTMEAGGLTGVTKIRNPVLVARHIIDELPHVILACEGAHDFARAHGFEMVDNDYFFTHRRWAQYLKARDKGAVTLDHAHMDEGDATGTVGAVALDRHGNLAAATSTGGMTFKTSGRVSDSAIPGAGTYAKNDVCAVSCTGTGDYFIRVAAAHDVAAQIEYGEFNLEDAAKQVLGKIAALGGEGGIIAISAAGDVVMPFNTHGMFRAARKSDGTDMTEMFGK